jgi:hypothetical protein
MTKCIYCGFCQELPDLAVDVPVALSFNNELISRCLFANEESTIKYLIGPGWSSADPHDAVKYATGVLHAVKEMFDESKMNQAASAMKEELSKWLGAAEVSKVFDMEDDKDGQEVDDLLRLEEFDNPRLLEICAAKRKSGSFVVKQVEHIIRNQRLKNVWTPWQNRLAPAHSFLKSLLNPDGQDDIQAVRYLCKVNIFMELKPAECIGITAALVKLGIFSHESLKRFIEDAADASTERLATLECLRKASKALDE